MTVRKFVSRKVMVLERVSYAGLLVAVLAFIWTVFGPAKPAPYIAAGDSVQAAQDLEREWQGESLLLVLSPTCSFCTASMPFYKLLRDQRNRQVNIIVAIDTSASASLQRILLTRAGIVPDTMIAIPTIRDGVVYVPTIIHVDEGGVAQNVWVGKLNSEQEEDVLTLVCTDT